MSFRVTPRRTVTALATVAALAVAASPASAKTHTGPTAPPAAHNVFKGPLTKAQKNLMRKADNNPAGAHKLQVQGKDTVSIFCGSVQRAYWGYWIKCHVVVVGGAYGYTDWYEYDYWNGYSWSYWFDALA
jgi:hypothetical protein